MEVFIELLRTGLVYIVEITGTLLDYYSGSISHSAVYRCKSLWDGCTRKRQESGLNLAESIAMALEFLLAAEVMHTVLANEVSDLIILGALVVLRAVMTVEIHWELKKKNLR